MEQNYDENLNVSKKNIIRQKHKKKGKTKEKLHIKTECKNQNIDNSIYWYSIN